LTNHTERNLLHAYLDDELDLLRSMELENHLAECADCSGQVESYRALRAGLGAHALRYSAPAQFRASLLEEIEKERLPEPSLEKGQKKKLDAVPRAGFGSRTKLRIPIWNWAALAACLVIAAAALFFGVHQKREHSLSQEIVADHVRSLMATHLTDVLTSDQHTVKPWFTGKLDFSPQVRDLSPQGYELVGGRLDYLDGHSVAAVVYQRRKHVINLLTWPADDADEQPKTSAQQGFNLIEWRQGGMYYCAVSDLNQPELMDFVSLLRK
jgi:anti-sigma factor RsiW